jgi:hypothetical protein
VPVVGDVGSNPTCYHHVHQFDGDECKTEKQVMSDDFFEQGCKMQSGKDAKCKVVVLMLTFASCT